MLLESTKDDDLGVASSCRAWYDSTMTMAAREDVTKEGAEPIGDLEIMCSQCGQDWSLAEADRRRAFSDGAPLPKRCPDCRGRKE